MNKIRTTSTYTSGCRSTQSSLKLGYGVVEQLVTTAIVVHATAE